jgi:hypothetical protein
MNEKYLGELVEKLSKLTEPYIKDPSKIYRDYAADYMYVNMKTEAIKSAFRAVITKPLNWVNIRTLLYCLRKSMVR